MSGEKGVHTAPLDLLLELLLVFIDDARLDAGLEEARVHDSGIAGLRLDQRDGLCVGKVDEAEDGGCAHAGRIGGWRRRAMSGGEVGRVYSSGVNDAGQARQPVTRTASTITGYIFFSVLLFFVLIS